MAAHQNIANDTLVALVGGDKGDTMTKLIIQIINSILGHSVMAARILGIFDGERDNRECIEKVKLKKIYKYLA